MDFIIAVMMLIFSASSFAHSDFQEPAACPRFTCEYKILERLIKLELEKGELTKEVRDLRAHGENQARLIQELGEKLETVQTAVAQKLIKPTIALKVRLSKDVILPNVHQKVVYDTIVINEGNAYDSETGIFRAPLNGTYIFSVTACATNNDQFSLYIVRDQQKILGELRSGDGSYKDCNSEVTTSYLNAGSTVWVERSNNPNDENVHGLLETVYWNSFTAVLVD